MDYEKTIKQMIADGVLSQYAVAKYCPQLIENESEDERIRKELIAEVKEQIDCIPAPDCRDKEDEKALKQLNKRLAWLEKQGEQKPNTDFSELRTWKYIVDVVRTEQEGIGQYLDSPFTEEVAKKLQKRFGNVEQKPAWSEEDDAMLDSIIEEVRYIGDFPDYPTKEENELYDERLEKVDWLKSIKERVGCEVNCTTTKEWSEEDEHWRQKAIDFMRHPDLIKATPTLAKDTINWLKSITPPYCCDSCKLKDSFKKKWKPSKEQMIELRKMAYEKYCYLDQAIIRTLYEDLKKL